MSALAVDVQPQLRVVAVGHVDHGKSTLIGRLLHDTGNLMDGKVAEMRAVSERRGVAFEWSFVLDALQSERDQAVTIDTTRIWMRTGGREVVLIDAPGHKEFLRNMVTGASDADAALLLVDAHDGLGEQTRRHALLLELIGVSRVVVAINKMDRVDYAQARFAALCAELDVVFAQRGIIASAFVPTCARHGENVVAPAPQTMPWYDGPTVLAALLALPPARAQTAGALRLAVQGIVRRDLRRIVVGRLESGILEVGAPVVLWPGGRAARVASLEAWPPARKTSAQAGESVGFTLDGPVYVERGDLVCDERHPPSSTTAFRARLLWLGERPLGVGSQLGMRLGTRSVRVEVTGFERVIEIESLGGADVGSARKNDVAEVVLTARAPVAFDTALQRPATARFILVDGIDVVAGGTVLEALPAPSLRGDVVPAGHLVDREARRRRNGHPGAVVWLTGLPAAGKSTIAMALERRLFEGGCSAYVLDGDNVRAGLCADLGFAPRERMENVRRVGEVAALFADAGIIAIAALVSPHRDGREAARRAAGSAFHEIYISAGADVRERRDPKGHYRRARAGELADFTGITGEYEEPSAPELVVDTAAETVESAVERVYRYVVDTIVNDVERPGRDRAERE